MTHPNETALRDAYAIFAKGDLAGFLACCTDDVTFQVPGATRLAGDYDKGTFLQLIQAVMEISGGTFQEDVLEVFANDDHGALLLLHRFERDGSPVAYRTVHVVELRGGRIASWREWPGDLDVFEAAWG